MPKFQNIPNIENTHLPISEDPSILKPESDKELFNLPPYLKKKQEGDKLKFFDPDDVARVTWFDKVQFPNLLFIQMNRANFYMSMGLKEQFGNSVDSIFCLMAFYSDKKFKEDLEKNEIQFKKDFENIPKNERGNPNPDEYNQIRFNFQKKRYMALIELMGRKQFLANKEF